MKRRNGPGHPGRRGWSRRLKLAAVLLVGLPFCFWAGLHLVPLPQALLVPPPAATELTDQDGEPLREVSSTELFSRSAALPDLPQSLILATLAAEDRRFWGHCGVDGRATARAAWQWLRHRRVISGGSTITQQLIKLAEPRERTLPSKLLEALQALRLEQLWTKRQILVAYLNRLDYGNLRRGCASAARYYFDRPLADLNDAESAFLAGLPQAPSRLNPHRHFDRAKRRQEWILARMRTLGWLEADAYRRALACPIRLRPPQRDFAAPHFVDLLLQVEARRVEAHRGGLVATTLDLRLQRESERILNRHLDRWHDRNVQEGALVVLNVAGGEVLALVGSRDYFSPRAGQVNGAWAPRSPGSTLKPFTYAIALEQGATAATVIPDVPTEFPTPTGVFAPVNYDRHYQGPTRLREALANSLNIPAVRTLNSIGGAAVLRERLVACGLGTLPKPADYYGLGLTLGNAEVRLLELANAYACLARLGAYREFQLLGPPPSERRGTGHPREPRQEPGNASTKDETAMLGGRRFDPDAAWLIADILSDNAARVRAFGLESPLRFDFPVACKTGTSTDFRDNWAFGYTPEFVVGVWVGNFDGTPMRGVSGVSGAAPIMHEVMTHLHTRFGTTWFPPPPNLVERTVDAITGKSVGNVRPGTIRERFMAPRLPTPEAASDYNAAGRLRLPVEYAAWLANRANGFDANAVAADLTYRARDSEHPEIRILQPLPGSTFILDPDLPDFGRWLPLRSEASGPVDWQSPTLFIDCQAGRPLARLTEGRHELIARDPASGREARTWITVGGGPR